MKRNRSPASGLVTNALTCADPTGMAMRSSRVRLSRGRSARSPTSLDDAALLHRTHRIALDAQLLLEDLSRVLAEQRRRPVLDLRAAEPHRRAREGPVAPDGM